MKTLYAKRLINMSIPMIFPVNINGDLRKNTELLMLELTERWKQELDSGNVVLFIDFKKRLTQYVTIL